MQRIRSLVYWAVLALLVYMPFHIFLSQSLSLLTGGLEVWKLAKDVILFGVSVFAICITFWQHEDRQWFRRLVLLGSAYAALHLLLWALHPTIFKQSALLGTIYNNRLWMFLALGASAGLLAKDKISQSKVITVVLAVSTVVALFGVAQYFLPHNLLAHVGYSKARGVLPAFFIDNNPAFPRVMSTLRDPNSLGAYLLLPLGAFAALLLRFKEFTVRMRALLVMALIAHLLAIYLTFSRSAWAGAIVTVGLVVWWRHSSQFVRLFRRWWPAAVVLVLLVASIGYAERHDAHLNGIVSHTTPAQVGNYDSNQFHWMYVRRGLTGIAHNPLGHGPGTAGLASIQNPKGGLLTENYYVQIGYEVGLLGLGLFVLLNAWVYVRLYKRHDTTATVLLASFWGYVLMNMLLHTWSNEAVAAQWWLLAGLALGVPYAARRPVKRR